MPRLKIDFFGVSVLAPSLESATVVVVAVVGGFKYNDESVMMMMYATPRIWNVCTKL